MPAISAGELGDTSKTCHTFSPARSKEQNLIEQPNKEFQSITAIVYGLGYCTYQTLLVRVVWVPVSTWCQADI